MSGTNPSMLTFVSEPAAQQHSLSIEFLLSVLIVGEARVLDLQAEHSFTTQSCTMRRYWPWSCSTLLCPDLEVLIIRHTRLPDRSSPWLQVWLHIWYVQAWGQQLLPPWWVGSPPRRSLPGTAPHTAQAL